MGYQYTSPVVVDDGSPDADPPGADYQPTAAPGCRAPHLWLADGTSTIDLFDQRFVLLTAEPGHAWRAAAAHATRAPVDSHVIPEPNWPGLYGVAPDGAVLVRPDGHVAWRSRTSSTDPVTDIHRPDHQHRKLNPAHQQPHDGPSAYVGDVAGEPPDQARNRSGTPRHQREPRTAYNQGRPSCYS
ncbi:hypothetical protein BCD49_32845 [Pseudofrankia sp. EUN1h]|nr:hypothetical protein BCD49_32845 [Pseudofrankia sp. EUN1h]